MSDEQQWPTGTVRAGSHVLDLSSYNDPQWSEIVEWLEISPPLCEIETFWFTQYDGRVSLYVTGMERDQ